MTALGWSLIDATAQLLGSEEREAVLGDLSEAKVSAWQGVSEVFGLFLRRQALLWKSWRPWLAAFGLTLPFSFLLMGFSLSVSETSQRLAAKSVNGLLAGNEILLLATCLLLLITWAWTSGFVVGSLSPRTLWVSIAMCGSPCLFCLARFRGHSLPRICLLLFLIPAIWGVRRGLRSRQIDFDVAIALAAAVTALMLLAWKSGGMPILSWALLWPAWCVAATARKPVTVRWEKIS